MFCVLAARSVVINHRTRRAVVFYTAFMTKPTVVFAFNALFKVRSNRFQPCTNDETRTIRQRYSVNARREFGIFLDGACTISGFPNENSARCNRWEDRPISFHFSEARDAAGGTDHSFQLNTHVNE